MRRVIILSVIATAILAACSGEKTPVEQLREQRDSLRKEMADINKQIVEVEKKIQAQDTTKKLTQITVQEVAASSFDHYFEVYGNVEAPENVLLSAQTGGEILSIKVQEGTTVQKGQLLLSIDAETILKNIDEVNNSLSLATDIFDRQKRLWNKNIGSEMQFLEAKNNKQSLEKKLATLNAQLDMAQVKAPFSGVVDEIMPNVGEMASPGMPLIRLVNLKNVYIKSDISERYLGVVTEGTRTRVEFEPLDLTIDTVVSRTGDFINPGNRTFVARIDIDNKNNQIKPNLMAKLVIRDFHQDSAIVLPSVLIQQTPAGDNFVYIASGKSGEVTVKKQSVEIGKSNAKAETMVLSGLKPGDIIVDQGSRSIKSGQKVTILKK